MSDLSQSSVNCCGSALRRAGWVFGVLGSFAVIGAITYYSVRRDPTPELDAQRATVRYQARRDLEGAIAAEVNKFAIDPNKENKAQLSVGRAMEVFLVEWKDDATTGRAKLLERLEASKKQQTFE